MLTTMLNYEFQDEAKACRNQHGEQLMYKIVMVEDDPIIRENFVELLADEGFEVEAFADSMSALERFEQPLPDLVILDITLGKESEAGFRLCTELRKRSETVPVIFFTSHGSDFDKISGMRLGVDDYITKDTNLQYVVIRIKALLRRVEAFSGNSDKASDNLERGDLLIDKNTLIATWKGEKVDISLTQFWILEALVKHPGHVKSHNQLMEAANIFVAPNTITAHVKSIRERFRAIDPDFSAIKTERGSGYRWTTS